ncbi:MAG: type ISP restriction/modification enzyme [Chlorobiaceae bacterium]
MSQHLIQQYLNQLSDLRSVSGSKRETVVREAFKDLLKCWAKQHDLVFIPEYEIRTPSKERRYVDGALLHTLRVPFGYWEAKDENDDLDAEIALKFKRGYPQDNIIFEDSQQAALIQDGQEIARCPVDDVVKLEKLLNLFFNYQRPEIAAFRKAVAQFKIDLPAVLHSLREMIEGAQMINKDFSKASVAFLEHVKDVINPTLTAADVREMLIQHILTEELFVSVFPGTSFHRDNNVARELYKLEATFFTGNTKFKTLKALEPYYAAIRAAASQISRHHEKQTFLKVIYENFYKVYNIKVADRLGVVYTPNEIVRFMVESTDWLCEKHFGRNLIDKDVDILDPAAGTGTFICEIMEHFRGSKERLKQKYLHELHANEVAILPYYVANLNIEATYAAIAGDYEEFPGLCFADTLDNTFALRDYHGRHQENLFGISDDNGQRIRQQNSRRISVIIGNPPYNANQLNENENNKNREYPEIDKRIKGSYIKASTAQKTKLYDMYARFFRWASDRLEENGIIAFVSNNSFIDSRTFDGFRKCLASEFNEVYVIDLKGDARTSGERRRQEAGNIFNDQIRVGVAVWFCVKKKGIKGCKIYYEAAPDYAKSENKLDFLSSTPLALRKYSEIRPDIKNNWINLVENDFETLMPLANKATKLAKRPLEEKAIFKLYSLGVVTNRDEWTTNFDAKQLHSIVRYFCDKYKSEQERWRKSPLSKVADNKKRLKSLSEFVSRDIKWTSELENHLDRGTKIEFDPSCIRNSLYRPYVHNCCYYARVLTHRLYCQNEIFPLEGKWENIAIGFSGLSSNKPFQTLAVNKLPSIDFLEKTQFVPRFKYDSNGHKIENITDWALEQFRKNYNDENISKESIFHYVYSVLHDPVYREKYALNLRRDFPRIPFYKDFWQWADWGKKLMDLHINYETVAPYTLQKIETTSKNSGTPDCKLKADKDAGSIIIDTETTLTGIPKEAWDYKLGNRSALEWVLDQYKESKPKDPTIREKFNTYRFADYKKHVIDLLLKVTTVSVETMKIINAMRTAHQS